MEKFIKPAFDDRNVPVAIMVSNQYAPYAGVFFQSLKEHASADHNYDIIVIDMGISAHNKTLLERILDADNFSVRFIKSAELIPAGVNLSLKKVKWNYFPDELCARLFFVHALDGFEKIVFVGADMLLRKDIADTMQIDLEGYCIGGVCTAVATGHRVLNRPGKSDMGPRDYMEQVLHMHSDRYLNSELIVYDVEKFCAEYPIASLIEAVQTPGIQNPDEGPLNMLLDGNYKEIDQAWNFIVLLNYNLLKGLDAADEKSRQAYEEAAKNPNILHFNARPKPWVCPDVPYGDEWWLVAQRTPFMGHIIARMVDELQVRREYYQERYGQSVQAWDPMPNVKRDY